MPLIDRNGKIYNSSEKPSSQDKALKFLYDTFIGRCFLKVLTMPFISEFVGNFMSSPLSKPLIKSFVQKNNINLSEYCMDNINSYNDFFTRKIRPSARNVDMNPESLISPCDSKLSVYDINSDSIFKIKGSAYSIYDMIKNDSLASKFEGGKCLIFRLEVTDYHRYCYFDSGIKSNNVHIRGVLHTVNPIAFRRYNVYKENSREYTLLHTKNFGDVVQIEVGAMMVGKIQNHHGKCHFSRGQEKGMFLFGGSTIVLLFQKNKILIDNDIVHNTKRGLETIVKYGEKIGNQYISSK